MFKYIRIVFCLMFLAVLPSAEAAPYEAEPLIPDEAALMGVYTGGGAMVIVGEAGGKLQLADGYIPNDKDKSNFSLCSLNREHYNAYLFSNAGPRHDQEGTANFERDNNGQGVTLRIDERILTRKFNDGENGKRVRIVPAKPLAQLRKWQKKLPYLN